ncbi:hypothetical protein N7462_005789 [Penicillium macrosclerotiorum]|uniref:uncharacterized protein n=1 Tax=Penicillium macrosclerotiorum TaxID=303699 RepID=UPI002549AE35|nr:uncharacterized protein N7462_005789 [Penicillium macrosclerotiorum]KAJ5682624.1 hypothetical protein N7462_005789 [Penicillium macrosclerotiorum]
MRLTTILLSLVTASLAAPTFLDHANDYSDDLANYLSEVSREIKRLERVSSSTTCDASSVTLPSYATSPTTAATATSAATGLPSPTGKLKFVALGRGTQNYTCGDASATPVAIGAVASLYNANCYAHKFENILQYLPSSALSASLPSSANKQFYGMDLLGHHFFYDSTTPEFNLNLGAGQNNGILMTSKQASLDAPEGAAEGEYGAVSWLYLTTKSGTVNPSGYSWSSVYRVDTAAGAAPSTCAEYANSAFEIQYSALYYIYGK